MKKILLTVFISAMAFQSHSVTRVTKLDPGSGTAQIKNFVNFTYDYSQFQMSIEFNYATLNSKAHTGNLNMTPFAFVDFSNLILPPAINNNNRAALAGASIAIWYPGSLPNNPTPANLVDFFQYGSAGHAYESVAVAAGLWTAGDFVSVAAPYQFNGGISDYGSSYFSTSTGMNGIKTPVYDLQVMPNPAKANAKLLVPESFNNTGQPVQLTIFNVKGEAVLTHIRNGAKEYFIDCSELADGLYALQLKDNQANLLTTPLVKKSD